MCSVKGSWKRRRTSYWSEWVSEWVCVDGRTALHDACSEDNDDAVQLLIHYGADVNVADDEGRTPLHCASTTNNTRCLQVIYHTMRTDVATYNTWELKLSLLDLYIWHSMLKPGKRNLCPATTAGGRPTSTKMYCRRCLEDCYVSRLSRTPTCDGQMERHDDVSIILHYHSVAL